MESRDRQAYNKGFRISPPKTEDYVQSGQRDVVKLEGEPLPSVNIFMQVPLLSNIVVEARKRFRWTNKSRLVAMEDLP